MAVNHLNLSGMYPARRRDAAEAAGLYIKAWEKKRMESQTKAPLKTEIHPTVCFSRQIGVGALEIADILAPMIQHSVADRLLIEEIAGNSSVKEDTVHFFDERYPGAVQELTNFLFGEKSFTMRVYTRALTCVVYALAMSEPRIIVGRGAHLILPRERVLSVRILGSRQFRAKRIAEIMNMNENAAAKRIDAFDLEQAEFFKKLTGRKEPAHEEFDLLINCDIVSNPYWAAKITAAAFQCKFGASNQTADKYIGQTTGSNNLIGNEGRAFS